MASLGAPSPVDASSLSAEEQDQILQTIDMFEVIAQSQPDDYQSIEILKEAYMKLGRTEDGVSTSIRLARAYAVTGQISLAFQECEGILTHQPDNEEIRSFMVELEHKMDGAVGPGGGFAAVEAFHRDDDPAVAPAQHGDPGRIIITEQTRRQDLGELESKLMEDDGNFPLAEFLIKNNLVEKDLVMEAMEECNHRNRGRLESLNGNGDSERFVLTPLLEMIGSKGNIPQDQLMERLIDRTSMAYVPIEAYQVDRHFVQMLPEALTLGRFFLPFDQLSRTIFVATCNPLDEAGREAVQQTLEATIHWYLASPASIRQNLKSIYRLDKDKR